MKQVCAKIRGNISLAYLTKLGGQPSTHIFPNSTSINSSGCPVHCQRGSPVQIWVWGGTYSQRLRKRCYFLGFGRIHLSLFPNSGQEMLKDTNDSWETGSRARFCQNPVILVCEGSWFLALGDIVVLKFIIQFLTPLIYPITIPIDCFSSNLPRFSNKFIS